MDQPTEKSTTIWMHGWSGQANLMIQIENDDLTESTLTTDGCMWKIFPDFKEVG
jgi:hypothetical protein